MLSEHSNKVTAELHILFNGKLHSEAQSVVLALLEPCREASLTE